MDYKNINKHLLNTSENLIRLFNDQISHIEDLLFFNVGEPDFRHQKILNKRQSNQSMLIKVSMPILEGCMSCVKRFSVT